MSVSAFSVVFFKQKTAYEMRISDWSSDVCSSDLLQDKVDNHWGRMLRAALISSLLGVGTELVSGGDSELLQVLRAGAQDGTNEAERRVVERELSIPPTLTVRPGFAFRVIVPRDLILEPIDLGAARCRSFASGRSP